MNIAFKILALFIIFIVWMWCYYTALFEKTETPTKNFAILAVGMLGALFGIFLILTILNI